MRNSAPLQILACVVFVALALVGAIFGARALAGADAKQVMPASMVGSSLELSTPEVQVVTAFETRLLDYLAVHRKFEATLPSLPKQATPEQIDANQQALHVLIASARADAKQGEFFTAEIQLLAQRALEMALTGPDGITSMASIEDENTGLATLQVNERYPEGIPLATTPLQVLEALPKLDEGLEYRFVGEQLVLVDTHANLIVDFTANILPQR